MRRLRQLLLWLCWACLALYALGILALAVLWSITPQGTWWLALSNIFAPLYFLPLIGLIPAALWIRSPWLLATTAVPTVAFVVLFGNLFLPRLLPEPPPGRDLRVATFNQLYYGQMPERIVEAIRAQDADIVAIQELHTTVAAGLQRDLAALYPYQYLEPAQGAGGKGVISRYPLVALQPFNHSHSGLIVDIDGQAVMVVNVHIHFSGISKVRSQRFFGLPYLRMYDMSGRLAQVEGLLNSLAPVQMPVIVLGDFNTSDREPGYAAMRAQFRDAFRETSAGFGYTFPYQRRMGPVTVPMALVRIDYIWTRGSLTPLSSTVRCVQGSDHCMVIADLRLPAS